MADVNSMVRRGIVSSVDTDHHTAQVYFPDMSDMVSGWLPVLHHGEAWDPAVNDSVVVLMGYGFNSDGYIVGVVP